MASFDLSPFKALTFDIIGTYAPLSRSKQCKYELVCFKLAFVTGTLVDYETGVVDFIRPRAAAAGADPSDQDILEAYARAERRQQVTPMSFEWLILLPYVQLIVRAAFQAQ